MSVFSKVVRNNQQKEIKLDIGCLIHFLVPFLMAMERSRAGFRVSSEFSGWSLENEA